MKITRRLSTSAGQVDAGQASSEVGVSTEAPPQADVASGFVAREADRSTLLKGTSASSEPVKQRPIFPTDSGPELTVHVRLLAINLAGDEHAKLAPRISAALDALQVPAEDRVSVLTTLRRLVSEGGPVITTVVRSLDQAVNGRGLWGSLTQHRYRPDERNAALEELIQLASRPVALSTIAPQVKPRWDAQLTQLLSWMDQGAHGVEFRGNYVLTAAKLDGDGMGFFWVDDFYVAPKDPRLAQDLGAAIVRYRALNAELAVTQRDTLTADELGAKISQLSAEVERNAQFARATDPTYRPAALGVVLAEHRATAEELERIKKLPSYSPEQKAAVLAQAQQKVDDAGAQLTSLVRQAQKLDLSSDAQLLLAPESPFNWTPAPFGAANPGDPQGGRVIPDEAKREHEQLVGYLTRYLGSASAA